MFCEIIGGRSPAVVEYEDDEVIVFRNRLLWVPVMLLAVPKEHMMQEELWASPLIGKIARIAVGLGERLCPNGFRLVSNVGSDAMQSQPHAHVHIVGGVHMGATGPLLREAAEIELYRGHDCVVSQDEHGWVPVLIVASPLSEVDQRGFWSGGDAFARVAGIALEQAQAIPRLRRGFRFVGNFGRDCGNPLAVAHLHVLGGIFLGEYVDT